MIVSIDDKELVAKVSGTVEPIILTTADGTVLGELNTHSPKLPQGFKFLTESEITERMKRYKSGRKLTDILKDLESKG